jgi:hypothetical protein
MTTTNQSSPDPPPQSPSTKTVTSLLSLCLSVYFEAVSMEIGTRK